MNPSITNMIEYVNHDNACKQASRWRRGSLDNILSIAMRIASEYIDRDESRERAGSVATMVAMNHASSSATRVAMNFGMFDCDQDRNKRTTSSNAKTRTKCNQRSKETCTFALLGLIGFARAHQSLAEEVKKGINNQLDCDCCCFPLHMSEVHGYLHSQPTKRVH